MIWSAGAPWRPVLGAEDRAHVEPAPRTAPPPAPGRTISARAHRPSRRPRPTPFGRHPVELVAAECACSFGIRDGRSRPVPGLAAGTPALRGPWDVPDPRTERRHLGMLFAVKHLFISAQLGACCPPPYSQYIEQHHTAASCSLSSPAKHVSQSSLGLLVGCGHLYLGSQNDGGFCHGTSDGTGWFFSSPAIRKAALRAWRGAAAVANGAALATTSSNGSHSKSIKSTPRCTRCYDRVDRLTLTRYVRRGRSSARRFQPSYPAAIALAIERPFLDPDRPLGMLDHRRPQRQIKLGDLDKIHRRRHVGGPLRGLPTMPTACLVNVDIKQSWPKRCGECPSASLPGRGTPRQLAGQ